MRLWEVIVVGAGPAGCRAAELLSRRGLEVLLLDPRVPWEKPCGGGLTAAALEHTPELAELRGESQAIREVMVMAPSGAGVVIPLRRPYLVVSRSGLSRWGLERARSAGARFQSRAVHSADRRGGRWFITDFLGHRYCSRRVIGADGAASRLRGLLAPRLRPELAPARVAYPQGGTPPHRAVFRFLPSVHGYLWDFPRPDHHSVGIGVPPGTFQRGPLDEAIAQYRLGEAGDSEPAEYRGAVIPTSRWSSGRFEDLGGRHFALLGDAAGLADPATGEGIDYALRSAALATEAYDERLGFATYPAAARAAFRAEMRRARVIRRWLYSRGVAEWLVAGARRSPRVALLLTALVDAINEHQSLRRAIRRGLFPGAADRRLAEAVCECPDGLPSCEPSRWQSETVATAPSQEER